MISIQGAALSSQRRLLDNALSAYAVASAITSRIGNHTRQESGLIGRIDAQLTITSKSRTCNNMVCS